MPLTPLEAAQVALDAASAALLDPPQRRAIVLARPAIDCDLLVVSVDQLLKQGSEDVGPLAHEDTWVTLATLTVTFAQCVTSTDVLPDVSQLQSDAVSVGGGGWAVWLALAGADFGDCRAVDLGPAVPLSESGGYAGWTIPVVVEVD